MSLFINQGKQDTSNDKSFEVMVSAEEIAQITKIEMDKDWPDTLNITFKVISDGKYKGRLFWDRVSFDPKGQFSWKYRNLRKSAGCPYNEDEAAKVDIEALLLNKAVTVELLVRKGSDGNDHQSVKYKASNKTSSASAQTHAAPVEETTIEDTESYDVTTDEDIAW
jgi:hypothetical protein